MPQKTKSPLDTLRDRIRAYGLSTLARDAGISRSQLQRFCDGSRGLTTDSLEPVLVTLGIGFAETGPENSSGKSAK